MLSRFERGQRLPVAARLPALLWIVFFYSLNIPKMVDFRGFEHSDVEERGRGALRRAEGGQERWEQASGSPKKQKIFYRASSGASGCPRLPVAARLPALLWIVFFYSLNIPKMVDFRGFEHSDVEERGRGALRRAEGGQERWEQASGSPKKQKIFYRASSGASGCPRLPVAARLPALLWIVFFYSLNIPKMVDFRGFEHSDVEERGRGADANGRSRHIAEAVHGKVEPAIRTRPTHPPGKGGEGLAQPAAVPKPASRSIDRFCQVRPCSPSTSTSSSARLASRKTAAPAPSRNVSVKMEVKGLNGKNSELCITRLAEQIDPEASYHKVSEASYHKVSEASYHKVSEASYHKVSEASYHKGMSDMVLVMLKKKQAGKTWAYVTEQEKKSKEMKKSIQNDVEELQKLVTEATRSRVKDLLNLEIRRLQTELKLEEKKTAGNNGQAAVKTAGNNGQAPVKTAGNNGQAPVKTAGNNGQAAVKTAGNNGQAPVKTAGNNGQAPVKAAGNNGQAPVKTAGNNGQAPVKTAGNNGQAPVKTSSVLPVPHHSLNIPKKSIFGVLSTQTGRKRAGEVGTSIGQFKKANIGGKVIGYIIGRKGVLNPSVARYKNWLPSFPCPGHKVVRTICILNVLDLPLLHTRKELFANKFYADYSRVALQCLAEELHNSTTEQALGRLDFNVTFYEQQPLIKNRLW
ncbi:hypothetical protein ACOMHN_021196 [Nucella lapillus]